MSNFVMHVLGVRRLVVLQCKESGLHADNIVGHQCHQCHVREVHMQNDELTPCIVHMHLAALRICISLQ